MTVIIEYREVKKKKLLFQFIFERNANTNGRHGAHVCTLDKYMSLDNWLDIYHRLDKYSEKAVKHPEELDHPEKINLRRAQLELSVNIEKISKPLARVLNLSQDELHTHYVSVSVKGVSRVSDYVKLCKEESPLVPNESPESLKTCSTLSEPSASGSQLNIENGQVVEEYIPTANPLSANVVTKRKKLPIYTPTKVLNGDDTSKDSEEYTPRVVQTNTKISVDENTYQPSPIVGTERQNHEQYIPSDVIDLESQDCDSNLQYKPSTNSNRLKVSSRPRSSPTSKHKRSAENLTNMMALPSLAEQDETPKSKRSKNDSSGSPSRLNRSDDLFGDLSDDGANAIDDNKNSVRKKTELAIPQRDNLLRRAKILDKDYSEQNLKFKVEAKGVDLKTPKISKWLCKDRSKENGSKENAAKAERHDKTERKRKPEDSGKSKVLKAAVTITEKEKADQNAKHLKTMDAMKQLQATLDEMNKPVTVDRIIDLKDLNASEIVTSFDDHGHHLNKLFEEYTKQGSYRVQRARDYDHMTILSALLNMKIVPKMVKRLVEEFGDFEKHGPITFDNLFWELMVPEWSLAIFMKRFGLKRAEALEQLRKQEIMSSEGSSSFEI